MGTFFFFGLVSSFDGGGASSPPSIHACCHDSLLPSRPAAPLPSLSRSRGETLSLQHLETRLFMTCQSGGFSSGKRKTLFLALTPNMTDCPCILTERLTVTKKGL